MTSPIFYICYFTKSSVIILFPFRNLIRQTVLITTQINILRKCFLVNLNRKVSVGTQ